MRFGDLTYMNPWWEGEEDYHARRWREQKIHWWPKWIKKLSLEPFSLNFVLGPRQVGKTTGIKLLIQKLLKENPPESILYINVEILPDYKGLSALIREFQAIREKEDIKTGYIFLDEATSLDGWWKGVKPLIDAGLLENNVVTVTGSSSLRVKRDIELFPGRRGKGTTLEVMPLSFGEYVEIMGLKRPELQREKTLKLFGEYLKTGGFPGTINGMPMDDLLGAYIGEFVRFGKNLEIAKETITTVVQSAPSATSFRALAEMTSGYSYKVVQDYIEFFRELYLLGIAYLKQGGRVLYRREKKFFFRDPLLAQLFSAWSGTQLREDALYEWLVQEHLYRKFGKVYYYRNSYEVDAIAGNLKVEVKAGKAHRRHPKTVTVLEKEDVPFFLLDLTP
ncbi:MULTISPECIES: ATP-binding protein [Thermococcus]|uniref:DEXX-box atpase n=1 Tax=Thermococcus sibiricus (strain DSM 12597 / MM 739) TaxID=604354 RepID=C6A5I4_THESM|nr:MULTISPECIES: ATP-binding protein [Thermococcus]ACS90879.1 DEXX-box atpase [Thermococcus sibiricus MM 739]MBC7094100.1 ATP-binding protein [Thermococcus sp.]